MADMPPFTAEQLREATAVPKPTPPPGRRPAARASVSPLAARPPAPKPGRAAPAPAASSGKEAKRADNAKQTLGLVSAGLTMLGMGLGKNVLLDDAGALAVHADDVGDAIAEQAETNDFVGGILDKLEMINGLAGLALVVMPLALQIMVNHRATTDEGRARVKELAPALQQFGVLEPEMLRLKVAAEHKQKMAQMKAEILLAQKEAEDRLAQVTSDLQNAASN